MQQIYAHEVPSYIDEGVFQHLLTIVSREKGNKIKRMARDEDKYRMLLGDVLIRNIASNIYDVTPESIEFVYNAYGKPFLKKENISFNLSHSGNWIACIINDGPVGIDIEKIHPIDLSIAESFFSPEEQFDLYQKGSEAEKLDYFYDLWTLKESFVKACGKGLSIPLDSFSVRKDDFGDIKINTTDFSCTFFFKQYNLDPQYKLSVCSATDDFPQEIILANLLEKIT